MAGKINTLENYKSSILQMINKTKLFTYELFKIELHCKLFIIEKNSKNTVHIFYDRNVLKKYTADI